MHNKDFESLIFKKASRKDSKIQTVGKCVICGRDWKCCAECSLSVLSNLFVLRFAIYALACLKLFVEYRIRVLNLWAGATQCQLRYRPDSNWDRNLRFWNKWLDCATLPLLTINSSRWTTLCVMRNISTNIHIYVYICMSLYYRRETWKTLK